MSKTVLFSIGVALAFMQWVLPLELHAEVQGECLETIQSRVHFRPISAIDRIAEQEAIRADWILDWVFLSDRFPGVIDQDSEQDSADSVRLRDACRFLSERIAEMYFLYFEDRLRSLLLFDRLREFSEEVQLLLSTPKSVRLQALTQSRLSGIENSYLHAVYQSLLLDLLGSEWESWSDIPVHLENWSDEFSRELGSRTNAGVLLLQNRVALQTTRNSVTSLKIFLFHELAHLAEVEYFHRTTALSVDAEIQNELYAWMQTQRFLRSRAWRTANPTTETPAFFVRVQENMQSMGDENWVRWIVRARRVIMRGELPSNGIAR